MANAVKLKRSSVAGKTPLITDLDFGELALNYADGRLYFKSSAGQILNFNAGASSFSGSYTDLTNKPDIASLVTGPGSATSTAIALYDGTTGKLLKNSLVTVSTSGLITAPKVGNIVPHYFDSQTNFPNATTYGGSLAFSAADARMYIASGGAWAALANLSDISDSNTTYTYTAQDGTAGVDLQLAGSDNTLNSINVVGNNGITITRNSNTSVTIGAVISYADLTNKPTIATSVYLGSSLIALNRASGALTLNDVSITGNAATVTNGVVTTASYGNPTWIATLAYSKLTGAPTALSSFTNDPGYQTAANVSTALSSYVTSSSLTTTLSSYLTTASASSTYLTQTTAASTYATIASLATVATSGSYDDLSNKPTIPAAQIQSDFNQLTDTALDFIKNKPFIPTDINQLLDEDGLLAGSGGGGGGSYTLPAATTSVLGGIKIGTGLNISGSGVVTAFDGNYNSLLNKPTIFNGAYSSLTGKPDLATVATTGSYNDLNDLPTFTGSYNQLTDKPTIPTSLTGLGITDGTNGQVLTTNGTGTFTFTTVSGGGGSSYTLPKATTSVLGGVKVDGITITVDTDGIISASGTGGGGGSTASGVVPFDCGFLSEIVYTTQDFGFIV